jgi:AraC family transcriptional regulator
MVDGSEDPLRHWSTLSAGRVVRDIEDEDLPSAPHHLVLVNLGRPFSLEEKVDGRWTWTFGGRGDVAILPAGHTLRLRTRTTAAQPVDTLAIALAPEVVARAVSSDRDVHMADVAAGVGMRDETIARLGSLLLAELDHRGPLDDLFVESVATALSAHLVRRHAHGPGKTTVLDPTPRGRLSRRDLGRVVDHVEANLVADLSLAELAEAVHLSPFHFAKLFKATTGLSPHQYVLRRRVESARELLTTTALPVAEVAARVGFSDQSHLSRHTKRLLGTTPRALRQSAG